MPLSLDPLPTPDPAHAPSGAGHGGRIAAADAAQRCRHGDTASAKDAAR